MPLLSLVISLLSGPTLYALPLDDFIQKAEVVFKKSYTNQQLNQGLNALKSEYKATQIERPWVVSSEINERKYSDIDGSGGAYQDKSTSLTNSVNYTLRNSLALSLSHTTSDVDYQEPPAPFKSSDESHSLALTLSYDIIRGGKNGYDSTLNQSSLYQIISSSEQIKSSKLENEYQFINYVLDLHTSKCKLQEYKKIEKAVQEVSEQGKARYKTKTISYHDYLTFIDTVNSYRQRVLAESAYFDNLLARNKQFGNNIAQNISGLVESYNCINNSTLELLPTEKVQISKTENFPIVKNALYRARYSESQARALKIDSKPSITPYLSYGTQKDQQDSIDQEYYAAGVKLTWNIGGKKLKKQISSLQKDQFSNQTLAELESQRLKNTIEYLIVEMNNNIRLINLYDTSLKNSVELIKTLRAQSKIGTLDPISLANASINFAESSNRKLEALSSLQKASFRVSQLIKSTE